jgi:hypothetical protein
VSQVTSTATIEQIQQYSPSALSGIGTNLFEGPLLAASRHKSYLNLYLMNVCFPPESCPLPGSIFSYLKVGKRPGA